MSTASGHKHEREQTLKTAKTTPEHQNDGPARSETARILDRKACGAVGIQGGGEGLQPPQAGNGEEEHWCGNGADL